MFPPRFRIERSNGVGVANDQLAHTPGGNNRRRAITLILGVLRSPYFLARVLVEGDRMTPLTPDGANQFVAVEEGMTGITPQSGFGLVLLIELFGPDDFS